MTATDALPLAWCNYKASIGAPLTSSLIAKATTVADCREALSFAQKNRLTLCTRAGAHCANDAITNQRNLILDVSAMNRILNFNEEKATITIEAGTTFGAIHAKTLPHNLVLSASPEQNSRSVGGAIASDSFSRDAAAKGSIYHQIISIKVLLATHVEVDLNPEANPEEFNAFVGSKGLLGIITQATLRLTKIPSSWVDVWTLPASDLSELMTLLIAARDQADFATATLYPHLKGKRFGAGIVEMARWRTQEVAPHEDKSAANIISQNSQAIALMPPLLATILSWPLTSPFMQRLAAAIFPLWSPFTSLAGASVKHFAEFNRPSLYQRILKLSGQDQTNLIFYFSLAASSVIPEVTKILEFLAKSSLCVTTCRLIPYRSSGSLFSPRDNGYILELRLIMPSTISEAHIKQQTDDFASQLARIAPGSGEILPQGFRSVKLKLDPEGVFASDRYRRLNS